MGEALLAPVMATGTLAVRTRKKRLDELGAKSPGLAAVQLTKSVLCSRITLTLVLAFSGMTEAYLELMVEAEVLILISAVLILPLEVDCTLNSQGPGIEIESEELN